VKAVLLSIQPEWCKKILDGEKTVEVRRTCPVHGTPFKVYIYCTLAGSDSLFMDALNRDVAAWNRGGWPEKRGRVIGEFTCKKITGLTHVGETGNWEPASLYVMAPGLYYKPADELLKAACMSKETVEKYLKGRDGYGWHISDLKIYDKPLPLSNFIPNCRHLEVEAGCRAYREHGWSCPDQRYDLNPDGSVNMAICQRSVKRPPQSWCYVEEKDIVDLLLYSNELEKQR
jgi:predicted transcriptional regulator